jgi:hypothetical protein
LPWIFATSTDAGSAKIPNQASKAFIAGYPGLYTEAACWVFSATYAQGFTELSWGFIGK